MYYCGWDGGGTKTTVCLTDADGHLQAMETFGPLNENGTAKEDVRRTLHHCLEFMQAQPGGLNACHGLTIGTAGISSQSVSDHLTAALRSAGYSGGLLLTGDHEIALAGAISGPGAICIAGTGSICYGQDAQRHTFRVGGYGHIIDDKGSGYAIGRDILTAVVQAHDGRGTRTVLTESVMNALHLCVLSDLITWLYDPKTGKKEIAALAPLLLPALASQDPAALSIAENAAQGLAEMAITGFSLHNIHHGELALMGGIFSHYSNIRSRFCDLVQANLPEISIIRARKTPAEGAADIARLHFPAAPEEPISLQGKPEDS